MGELFLSGLGSGAAYALFGLAVVIVYRSGGVFNIAITAVGAVGAYISYVALAGSGVPWGLAIILGMLAGGAANSLIYVLIVRVIPAGGIIYRSVATLGCLLMIEGAITQIWGFQTYAARPLTLGSIGGHNSPYWSSLILLGVVATIVFVYYEVLPAGRVTRAIDEGPATVGLLGVIASRWQAFSWFLSGIVGTLGALVLASNIGLSSSGFDVVFATGIIGVAIGGFDSFLGVVIGGLFLGVVGDLCIRYLPTAYEQSIIFGIAVVVLLLRPNGMIGRVRVTVSEFARESRTRRLTSSRVRIQSFRHDLSVTAISLIALSIVAITAPSWGTYTAILTCEFVGATIPAVLGMTVSTGYAGLFNVAPAALSAIGGYSLAIIAEHWGAPFLIVLIVALLLVTAVGFVIGVILSRVKTLPFGIVTIAFSAGIGAVVINLTGLTGGDSGLLIMTPKIFGWSLASETSLLTFEVIAVLLAVALVFALRYSHLGRSWLQIKGDEVAARALGLRVGLYKGAAMAVSALLCGLSGVLFALYLGVVTPGQLSLVQSLNIVVALIVGGELSIVGAFLGSIYLAVVSVDFSSVSYGTTLVSGGVLLVIMLTFPAGLGALLDRLMSLPVELVSKRRHTTDTIAVGASALESEAG